MKGEKRMKPSKKEIQLANLNAENRRNRLLAEQNAIARLQSLRYEEANANANAIEERKLAAQNRVDISLNEYNELVKENEALKKENERKSRLLEKIILPLCRQGVSDEDIQELFGENTKVEVHMFDDPLSLNFRVGIVFEARK